MIAPRFRTKEDALKAMLHLRNRDPIPPELWVHPFKQLPNGDVVMTKEYRDCPYELSVVDKEGKPWRILG